MDSTDLLSHSSVHKRRFSLWNCFAICSVILVVTLCALVMHTSMGVSESCKYGLDCSDSVNFKESPSALSQCQDVCATEQCINAAAHIFGRMDTNVDPCEDFYSFACGRFPEDSFFDENDYPISDFFTLGDITSANALRVLLKDWESANSEVSESLRLKREKLYKNCIDERIADGEAISTLLKFVSNAGIPKWPHLEESWELNGIGMARLISKFSAVGISAFANIVLGKSSQENAPQLVYLRPGDPFLEDCGDGKVTKIKKFLKTFLIDLGMPTNESHGIVETVAGIDLFLANRKDEEDDVYTSRRIIDCNGVDPSSENIWCRIVRNHAEESGFPLQNVELNVTLSKRGWFNDVENILESNPDKVIAHYLAIHFILEYEELLGSSFRKQGLNISSLACVDIAELGVPAFEERSKWCMKWLARYVTPMLKSDYVKNHISEAQINEAKDVLAYIKQVEISRVRNATCLPESISTAILFNVNYMTLNLDFFYKYEKERNISEDMYAEFNVTGNNFNENYLEYQKFIVFMDLKHKTRNYVWDLSPNQFVFGTSSGALIDVQFGVFQRPAFNPGQPRYIDFAKFGFLISHETGHNIFFELKFQPEVVTPMDNLTQCLTTQYSQYKIPYEGVNVDGKKTLGENVADYIGWNVAFKAYKTYQDAHGKEPSLPGLNFTNEQLFFISAGQFLCEYGDRRNFEQYKQMVHSPMKYRVHGPLVNNEQFADTFNCPVGSPMNPSNKCSLKC